MSEPHEPADMAAVVSAAIEWWLSHRPVKWGEGEHLHNPTVNLSTVPEGQLAVAVAAFLKAAPLAGA